MEQKQYIGKLNENWIKCSDALPPLRCRVLITDGNITTMAWISDYRKGWEGWVLLGLEYLGDVIAWQHLPTMYSD